MQRCELWALTHVCVCFPLRGQMQTPSNRKGHSAVVVGSAMLVYGGFVDMKGSSQDFWSLDFGGFKLQQHTHTHHQLCCDSTFVCVRARLADLVPPERFSERLGGARQQTRPLRHSPPELHVPVRRFERFTGAERLLEVEFHPPHVDVAQKQVCDVTSHRYQHPVVIAIGETNGKASGFRRWSLVLSPPPRSGPSRLVGHSAVVYRDGMLLFGGGESQHSPSSGLWRYSFTSLSWTQVAALPGSGPPRKIHHCCVGLGPGYRNSSPRSGGPVVIQTKLQDSRTRPFKNKCFPAPLTFLGSDGAIELETFSPDRCYRSSSDLIQDGTQQPASCLTFENKVFKQKSTEEEEEEDEDVAQHLPDLLLVLGGRPCSSHAPISVWQVTLTDS